MSNRRPGRPRVLHAAGGNVAVTSRLQLLTDGSVRWTTMARDQASAAALISGPIFRQTPAEAAVEQSELRDTTTSPLQSPEAVSAAAAATGVAPRTIPAAAPSLFGFAPVAEFLTARTERAPSAWVGVRALREAYLVWALDSGRAPLGRSDFYDAVLGSGVRYTRYRPAGQKQLRTWWGLRLKPVADTAQLSLVTPTLGGRCG
jgi:hypothetical protein